MSSSQSIRSIAEHFFPRFDFDLALTGAWVERKRPASRMTRESLYQSLLKIRELDDRETRRFMLRVWRAYKDFLARGEDMYRRHRADDHEVLMRHPVGGVQ